MTENSVASYLHHAVVVGVDGSTSSWAAINAAAWEAQERGQDLVLAHGYHERMPYLTYGWSPYVPSVEDVYAGPKAMLSEAAAKIRPRYPDLPVHTQLLAGSGASALIQLSEAASMLVVGSRGDGGFAGLSIGSTAAQTAAYARCPVMVIRPEDPNLDEATPRRNTQAGSDPGRRRRVGTRRGRAAVRFRGGQPPPHLADRRPRVVVSARGQHRAGTPRFR
jgi:nucleotide-binding universal stress UspA family protein